MEGITDIWLCIYAFSAYGGKLEVDKILSNAFEIENEKTTTKKMKNGDFWYGKFRLEGDGNLRLTAWVEEGWAAPLLAHVLCEDDCQNELD